MERREQFGAHPLTILGNLWRVLYLVVIPVLRGFFVALQGMDLTGWAQGAWIDISVFMGMITFATWRWRRIRYTLEERAIVWEQGWPIRNRTLVPWEKIVTLSVVEPFYMRPFRAARVRADTIGGSAGRADFTILLWRGQAQRMLDHARARAGADPRQHRAYTPRTGSILALALLTSNSLGGIIFIAAFLSQAGRLLGNEFSQLVVGTFEQAARILAFGVPPAAAALAYLLLAGWLIGFSLTFFRYKNFRVSRSGHTLDISGGLATHREYCIDCGDINFIDIRQSITTKILKLYSLYISAVGYAKLKDDLNCIIPTEGHETFSLHRERLFPAFSPTDRQIAPGRTAILRFVGMPVALCLAIPLVMWLLIRLFPGWQSFVLFVGLMSMIPALFFLTIRTMEHATGGVAKSGRHYTVRYSSGFYLHTVVIPEDTIVGFELRQSFFQKFTPNCDLLIYTRAETQFVHCCRSLDKRELEEFFGILRD